MSRDFVFLFHLFQPIHPFPIDLHAIDFVDEILVIDAIKDDRSR